MLVDDVQMSHQEENTDANHQPEMHASAPEQETPAETLAGPQHEEAPVPMTAAEAVEVAVATDEETAEPAAPVASLSPEAAQAICAEVEDLLLQLSALAKGAAREVQEEEIDQLQGRIHEYIQKLEEADQDAGDSPYASAIAQYRGRLKELVGLYEQMVQQAAAAKAAEEQANLDKKWALIQQLRDITDNEQRIAQAFKQFNEILAQWRATGPVPSHIYQQLRNAWSYEIDRFYYTINIYKDLRDLDLQKNLQLKQELIEKMHVLSQEPSIKRIEMLVKVLQEEWDETGPVPHEQWEAIRDTFFKATDKVYERINKHYDDLRSQFEANLVAKRDLIAKVRQISHLDLKSARKWNDKTTELKALQEAWKKTGRVGKDQQDAVWEEFRGACDEFFARKRSFFHDMHAAFEEGKKRKKELLLRAEAFKDSTDWKGAADALMDLQKLWKEAPSADRNSEQELWEKFRAVCDHFFEARKAHFAGQRDEQADNEKAKKALLETVQSWSPTADREADFETLKDFARQWKEIGHVPRKVMQTLNDGFKAALDAQYAKLKMDKGQRGNAQYKARLSLMAEMPDAKNSLQHEKRQIRQRLQRLEAELQQYERNMGMFRITTKNSPIVAEMQGKMDKTRELIDKAMQELKQVEAFMNQADKQ